MHVFAAFTWMDRERCYPSMPAPPPASQHQPRHSLPPSPQFVLHLLTGAVPVLSGILLIFLWTWVTYALSLRVPYFGQGPSIARSVVAGAIAGAFVASTAQRGGWTLAWALLVALAPACGVLAAVATRARIRAASAVIAKFEEIRRNREQTDKRVHRFFDQEDAEVGGRGGAVDARRWQSHAAARGQSVGPSYSARSNSLRSLPPQHIPSNPSAPTPPLPHHSCSSASFASPTPSAFSLVTEWTRVPRL